ELPHGSGGGGDAPNPGRSSTTASTPESTPDQSRWSRPQPCNASTWGPSPARAPKMRPSQKVFRGITQEYGPARYRRAHASLGTVRATTLLGNLPLATSAMVTTSSTERRVARVAIHTSFSDDAAPRYSICSGGSPRTSASGPSTARTTSAIEMLSAGTT